MNKKTSGQALLMVLLSIGVIITIALSVASRSISDISVTTQDEESLRAFSAAEAGVEDSLKQTTATLPSSGTTSKAVSSTQTYNASFATFPENPTSYLYPAELSSGDVATIWLATHSPTNTLTCGGSDICYTANTLDLCWGKLEGTASTQPALAVAILYEDSGILKYAYTAFDPNTSRGNHFQTGVATDTSAGTCTVGSGGTRVANRVTLAINSLVPQSSINNKLLKSIFIMTLYNTNPTILGVNTTQALPVQGRRIDSSGVSGGSTRKVQVYSLFPEVPSIFHSAIFSPPGVTK